MRFAGLLFKSASQLLHYVAASLPPTHQDEEDEEEDEKDTRELTALQKVGEYLIAVTSFLYF